MTKPDDKQTRPGIGIGVGSLLLAIAGLAMANSDTATFLAAEGLAVVLGLVALITGRGRLAGFVGFALAFMVLYSTWVALRRHL